MALLGWIAVPNKWMTNLYGFDGCTGIASVQFFPKSKMAAGVVYYYCSPRLFEFYFFRFFFCCVFFSGLSLRAPNYLSLFRGICMCHVGVTRVGSRPWAKGRGGWGRFFVPCPVGFSSFCHNLFFFFFLPKLRGGGGRLGLSAPSPRSTTGLREVNSSLVFT